MRIIFSFSCSGMFRDVPECFVFRVLSTADQHVTSVGQTKNLSPRQLEPMTSQTPGGHSIHFELRRTHGVCIGHCNFLCEGMF